MMDGYELEVNVRQDMLFISWIRFGHLITIVLGVVIISSDSCSPCVYTEKRQTMALRHGLYDT